MDAEWADLTMGDLGQIITGKTPLTTVESNFNGHIPFVTPSDMDGRRVISETSRYLTTAGAESVKGAKIPKGSVMVSCIGSDMGKAAIAGRDCVTNQQINSIVVDHRFHSEYVYYNLSTRKNEIRHQAAGGSAQPILNKTDFSRLRIALPPLAEQKLIAGILESLDDKIELNRRMNETLEGMARALFKSWFVDFDPVRAKMDGRPPFGMDAETAALFPDSFQDSELGPIPKAWKVRKLIELTKYLSRGIGPSYTDKGGVLVLNQKCIRDGGVNFELARRHNPNTRSINGREIETLDILVNSTGVGTLGRVAQVSEPPEMAIVDSHITVVRAANGVNPYFLGVNLSGRELEIEALGEGSTGQTELSRTRLGELTLLVPPSQIQSTFGGIVKYLNDQIDLNRMQNSTLARLRDRLLVQFFQNK